MFLSTVFILLVGNSSYIAEPNYIVGYKDGLPYLFEALVAGYNRENEPQLLQKEAAENFREMAIAAEKDGFTLTINYGFRTKEQQQRLRRETPRLAGKAGHSPHQEGIAVDIAGPRTDGRMRSWLRKNATQFGFRQSVYRPDETWHWQFDASIKPQQEQRQPELQPSS